MSVRSASCGPALDAGRFSTAQGSLPLIGTLQAAGPGAVLRNIAERQAGLSPAIGRSATRTTRWRSTSRHRRSAARISRLAQIIG